jgi:hypothetical protein
MIGEAPSNGAIQLIVTLTPPVMVTVGGRGASGT